MSVASLLMTKAPIGSEKPDGSRANVLRPYTPLSRPDAKGYLDLAVKVYPEVDAAGFEPATSGLRFIR